MIGSTADDNQGVHDAKTHHGFDAFIKHQKTGDRQNIGKCNRRFGRTKHECVEDSIANHQIEFVLIGVKTFYTQQNLAGEDWQPAQNQEYKIVRCSTQMVCYISAIIGRQQSREDDPDTSGSVTKVNGNSTLQL